MTPATIALTGASGTIGSATLSALEQAGYTVVRLSRQDIHNPAALEDQLRSQQVTTVVSCMASRTGTRADAWRVDHDAQLALLRAAERAGVKRFILLSAICLQRPRLAFQEAKLAFEAQLQRSSLQWTIIRPTAFFKSLSGQLHRVSRGKSFLVFGDGRLTACKPISDRDLSSFIVHTLNNPLARHAVLPIGGPGPALTPLDQARLLSNILGKPVRVRQVPPALLLAIGWVLSMFSRVIKGLEERAEYARIGHYYATESMLVWNSVEARYDDEATPSWGHDTLEQHYRHQLSQIDPSRS
ncbi:MAG: hypothetical protein RLY30_1663 [Pseudomonadota bacterium]|jgi:divinyl chlorophyllide a 8-vinyl-reductase